MLCRFVVLIGTEYEYIVDEFISRPESLVENSGRIFEKEKKQYALEFYERYGDFLDQLEQNENSSAEIWMDLKNEHSCN